MHKLDTVSTVYLLTMMHSPSINHIFVRRPLNRPFPRIFSCSSGHETVDCLVSYFENTRNSTDTTSVINNIAKEGQKVEKINIQKTSQTNTWTINFANETDPHWVVIDIGSVPSYC